MIPIQRVRDELGSTIVSPVTAVIDLPTEPVLQIAVTPEVPLWVPRESVLWIQSDAEVEWINSERERREGRTPLRVVPRRANA